MTALKDNTVCSASAFGASGSTSEKCFCEEEVIDSPVDRSNHNKSCGGTIAADVYATNDIEPGHDATKTCAQKADVLIVLDESGSVGEDNFWSMKHAV